VPKLPALEHQDLAANEGESTRIKKNHLPQISQMSADQENQEQLAASN
jgi:hypothetical protein